MSLREKTVMNQQLMKSCFNYIETGDFEHIEDIIRICLAYKKPRLIFGINDTDKLDEHIADVNQKIRALAQSLDNLNDLDLYLGKDYKFER